MDVYRTEEEQIEAIKRWWNENGKPLVLGVVVVVCAWFGWNFWQNQQQATADFASDIYLDLMEAMQLVSTVEGDEKAKKESTAKHLAEKLKSEFTNTTYAQYAALFLAKRAVENNELDVAADELQWVLSKGPSEHMSLLAKLRLARVLFAQSKFDESLKLIENVDAGTLQSSYEEVKGDIYISQGRTEDARIAYNKAKALIPFDIQRARRPQNSVLDMKLNDLAPQSETTPATTKADTAAVTEK